MLSKRFYYKILIRLFLIVMVSVGGTLVCVYYWNIAICISFALLIVIMVYSLLRYFNSFNRKIAFFFDAVANDDTSLYYPDEIDDSSIAEVNRGLNRVNSMIQEVKLKIKEQDRYYSVLLEQVQAGILVMNNNGNILKANTAAKRLLNYEALNHIDQLKKVDSNLYNTFSHLKDGENALVRIQLNNNTKELTIKTTHFAGSLGNYFLITIQDIKDELETKELDSWQNLIRVLTHEIMNSISPIISLSDTLIGGYTGDERTLKGLNIIKDRGEGLLSFVNSYRRLTRLPKPNEKKLEISALLLRVIDLMDYKDLSIERNIQESELFIDEAQMSQVFINILKNAYEAIENTDRSCIQIIGKVIDNDKYCIEFKDNGKGISNAELEHIFIPFFTTKDSGSGIGLSLSRQIIRNHGGSIEVSSIPNQETSVCIYLPLIKI
ncbi:GHKL domain-containing protein [Marinilabiliaceae bacterium JC040]|nr:GHKL domain-containing protein [Marinilabiliaceae bacterium JC040]